MGATTTTTTIPKVPLPPRKREYVRTAPNSKALSKTARLRLLGIPKGTGLNMFDRLYPKRKEIMEGTFTGDWSKIKKREAQSSKYRGVSLNKRNRGKRKKPWRAQICHKKILQKIKGPLTTVQSHYIGCYETELQAAQAYDTFLIKFYHDEQQEQEQQEGSSKTTIAAAGGGGGEEENTTNTTTPTTTASLLMGLGEDLDALLNFPDRNAINIGKEGGDNNGTDDYLNHEVEGEAEAEAEAEEENNNNNVGNDDNDNNDEDEDNKDTEEEDLEIN